MWKECNFGGIFYGYSVWYLKYWSVIIFKVGVMNINILFFYNLLKNNLYK